MISGCLCGHNESCSVCDGTTSHFQKEIDALKKALLDIYSSADDAMGESNMPAKALISFRWIKKLAAEGLHKDEIQLQKENRSTSI